MSLLNSALSAPAVLIAGVALMLAAGIGGVVAILEIDAPGVLRRRRPSPIGERERDLAAALGIGWTRWVTLRVATLASAVVVGLATGLWVVGTLLAVAALFGLPFALAGRAATRRLRMERAFLAMLRHIRDRMAVGNQSLDTALQEAGRNPGAELQYVLAPLRDGASIVDGVVACALRARSPIVEQACCVLIWARARNLDALIAAIDDVLLPVGDAQLAVQEEAMVTLAQQRAVTFAMAALMGLVFAAVLRVEAFRAFYQTPGGIAVLVGAVGIFLLLVTSLDRIVSIPVWTRWNMRRVAELERLPRE